jgi:hypothetical protein
MGWRMDRLIGNRDCGPPPPASLFAWNDPMTVPGVLEFDVRCIIMS